MTTLEKIRAEIESEYNKFRNRSEVWDERANGIGTALEIIDKYAEQEPTEDGKEKSVSEVRARHIADYHYQRGLGKAWECGKRIASETSVVLSKIFGEIYPSAVFQQYSPQEAMQKIKEYEERQTEKTTIKIWGEDKTFTVCNEDAYRQVCKERDIAIEQLHELGYELGQKIEPCDDAISRQAVLDCATLITSIPTEDWDIGDWVCLFRDRVSQLPPVRPQEQTGHWKRISMDRYTTHAQYWYECDKCGEHNLGNKDFCPNCGARMESEDKE